MKYIICITPIIICLFIGYRLANLDKPMEMELWETDEPVFELAWDAPVDTFWVNAFDETITVDSYSNIYFHTDEFKNVTMQFPDGHEETIDLEALQQAGSLESYFKEHK